MIKNPPQGTQPTISIAREGGVGFFPGLASPRQIDLASCSADEQERILALLAATEARATPTAGRGDRRYFRIEISAAAASGAAGRTLLIAEQDAAEDLVRLWEQAA